MKTYITRVCAPALVLLAFATAACSDMYPEDLEFGVGFPQIDSTTEWEQDLSVNLDSTTEWENALLMQLDSATCPCLPVTPNAQ